MVSKQALKSAMIVNLFQRSQSVNLNTNNETEIVGVEATTSR